MVNHEPNQTEQPKIRSTDYFNLVHDSNSHYGKIGKLWGKLWWKNQKIVTEKYKLWRKIVRHNFISHNLNCNGQILSDICDGLFSVTNILWRTYWICDGKAGHNFRRMVQLDACFKDCDRIRHKLWRMLRRVRHNLGPKSVTIKNCDRKLWSISVRIWVCDGFQILSQFCENSEKNLI